MARLRSSTLHGAYAAALLVAVAACGDRTPLLGEVIPATSVVRGSGVVTLATELAGPTAITVQGSNVYFVAYDMSELGSDVPGLLFRLPVAGGAAGVIGQASGMQPTGLATDGTNVYWTATPQSMDTFDGALLSTPVGGGATVTLASAQYPAGVALDGAGSVYFTDNSANAVIGLSTQGGFAHTLTGSSNDPSAIAATSTTLYWQCYGTATLQSMSTHGGHVSTLLSDLASPAGVAVDATNVYSVDANGVVAVPLAGGTPTTLASIANAQGRGVASDGANVYFVTGAGSTGASGVLAKVPVGGGATVTLATGLTQPGGVAVDETSAYYTDSALGVVVQVSPK